MAKWTFFGNLGKRGKKIILKVYISAVFGPPATTVVCGFEACLRVSARIPPSLPQRERREQSINYIGGSIYHHLPSPLSRGGDTAGENSQTRFGATGGKARFIILRLWGGASEGKGDFRALHISRPRWQQWNGAG